MHSHGYVEISFTIRHGFHSTWSNFLSTGLKLYNGKFSAFKNIIILSTAVFRCSERGGGTGHKLIIEMAAEQRGKQ